MCGRVNSRHTAPTVQVPKMLGTLRSTWAPDAFIVSFKLETDEQILISKVMACLHPHFVAVKHKVLSSLTVSCI